MQRKLIIGDEEANRQYNLRTTNFILTQFLEEAEKRGVSANYLMNKTLLPKATFYHRNKNLKNK